MTVAGVGAALLLAFVAVFQFRLASGAPFGDMAYGGRAPTVNGVLTRPFRVISSVAVGLLLYAAWIVLAAVGVFEPGTASPGFLRTGVWIILGFLVLSTIGSAAARTRQERLVFAPISGVAAALTTIVALGL